MQPSNPMCVECGRPMQITRYCCPGCELTVEGSFELTPLAKLSLEEQAFVTAFVREHGNIKKMEELFEVSYPTIKNRLNAIARKLDAPLEAPDLQGAVLDRLARGELTVDQALEQLG